MYVLVNTKVIQGVEYSLYRDDDDPTLSEITRNGIDPKKVLPDKVNFIWNTTDELLNLWQ